MRSSRLIIPIAAGLVLASCSSTPSESGESSLMVLGAASTRVINEDLSARTDTDLEFLNAGSPTLVQQLEDGAPGDVLITADQPSMDRAVALGVAADPQVVATNSLVMVVPAGNPAGITPVSDLAGTALVLCDVQVPCGAASGRIIEDQHLDLSPVSLEHSVSDVLGKVVSGQADAGWVYRTDAAAAGGDVEVIELPGADAHPNSVLAAVTTATTDREAAHELVDLLRSGEMEPVWAEHGFGSVQ